MIQITKRYIKKYKLHEINDKLTLLYIKQNWLDDIDLELDSFRIGLCLEC